MSLHAQTLAAVLSGRAATAKAAFPCGYRYMTIRDELGAFYRDEEFAELFVQRFLAISVDNVNLDPVRYPPQSRSCACCLYAGCRDESLSSIFLR